MFEIRESQKAEDELRVRYSILSKIFLVVAILFIIWVVLVALGIIVFELGPTWALLTLDNWIYAWCILTGFFVVLEVFFYLHFIAIRNKRLDQEKSKPEFIDGKRLYFYTHPKGAEGGIFSKTLIKIDENSVLRLRALVVPPGTLWSKKEEE